mgnify:CR=1 FL=1
MPASTPIAIADAVAARLQAGAFSLPIQVQRGYRPVVDLSALTGVTVTVVPKSLSISAATRADGFCDCAVDVGVQAKVDPESLADLDALMRLVEELGDSLRLSPLAGVPGATWLSLANEPIFAPEHLEQQHVLTSVLTVTYRVRR